MKKFPYKYSTTLVLIFVAFLFFATYASSETENRYQQIPVQEMVTMVDLGAKKCIPCKMMAPIMLELEEEYKDRAAIIFIDVWENPKAARRFKVQTIPTQIFYSTEGKEMFRHVGFFDKKSIVAELQKLGVE